MVDFIKADLTTTWRVYCDDVTDQGDLYDYCSELAQLTSLTGVRCSAVLDPPCCCLVTFQATTEDDRAKLKRVWELFHDVTVRSAKFEI